MRARLARTAVVLGMDLKLPPRGRLTPSVAGTSRAVRCVRPLRAHTAAVLGMGLETAPARQANALSGGNWAGLAVRSEATFIQYANMVIGVNMHGSYPCADSYVLPVTPSLAGTGRVAACALVSRARPWSWAWT